MAVTKVDGREEIEKKIIAAFKIFDHENNNTVDVREVGTIIRSLGCCPGEADLKTIIYELQDKEENSFIELDRFLSLVMKIIEDGRHAPCSYNLLLGACQLFDTDGKGLLTWEELKQHLTTSGEPFSEEEAETLAGAFVDPDTQQIDYRDWITWLVTEQ